MLRVPDYLVQYHEERESFKKRIPPLLKEMVSICFAGYLTMKPCLTYIQEAGMLICNTDFLLYKKKPCPKGKGFYFKSID
jgi:hypothetical protein